MLGERSRTSAAAAVFRATVSPVMMTVRSAAANLLHGYRLRRQLEPGVLVR
jgi:hypothetical protein